MKNSRLAFLTTVMAVVGIVAYSQANTPLVQTGAQKLEQTRAQKTVVSRGWGVSLVTERPFIHAGGAVRATYVITNSSDQDAYGWTSSGGSHGCTYDFTIVNAAGRTVWQPGKVERGDYSAPLCMTVIGNLSLSGGATLQGSETISLIYQNGHGVGVQGAPLEPGSYQLCITVDFNGPNRAAGPIGPGLNYSARVPIRIEP